MQGLSKIIAFGLVGWIAVALPAHAGTLKTLYSFKGLADGGVPVAGLLFHDGALYGTAFAGGAIDQQNCPDGCGIVFKVNPDTGAETVLHSFTNVPDGGFPAAGLTYAGGLLYGTTSVGGKQTCPDSYTGCGTVFKLDPTTGVETVIYNFKKGGGTGQGPVAGLVYQSGILYGTASEGGRPGAGTVFAVNAATGAGTLLYAFKGQADGENPLAGLMYRNGMLFGTTLGLEQPTYRGTVFAVNAVTHAETVLHDFEGADGEFPEAPMIFYHGLLYGTTAGPLGTIFSVNPKSKTEAVVYNFTGGNGGGYSPVAGLINVGGIFYGTTKAGGLPGCTGNMGCGTIFSFDPATDKETVLYRFTGESDEGNPQAGLIYEHGAFYGTTGMNGINSCYNQQGCGTVFKFKP
jgi:uncharacterized repeat protein (TIGR03803 family)